MESRHPITAGMVPPPPAWLPGRGPVEVTVVDVGHDGWRAAADPLLGAGGWLRGGSPGRLPVLVVRATRPSLCWRSRCSPGCTAGSPPGSPHPPPGWWSSAAAGGRAG